MGQQTAGPRFCRCQSKLSLVQHAHDDVFQFFILFAEHQQAHPFANECFCLGDARLALLFAAPVRRDPQCDGRFVDGNPDIRFTPSRRQFAKSYFQV